MDQATEVKQRTDIASIIGERIEVKKAGRNYKALCPFHGEKSPSFMISGELQIFKCFGCGESGDVFTFLEKYEGMDFSEALKYLADRAGIKLKSYHGETRGIKDTLLEVNSWTARFYNHILLNHKLGALALKYLVENRGITVATIKEFNLGFAPSNSSLLSRFLVEKKKFRPQDLETAGIGFARSKFIIDRMKGRVIFPISDSRGNTIAFAGRILPGSREDMAKYINSPETPIYHKSATLYGINLSREFIKRSGVAVVVEGELDMISSWQIGIKNVVAIKGSALTDEQVRLLARFTKKITLALDSDFAGNEAAKKGIKTAQAEGLEVNVAGQTRFKDPDEAARSDPESYKESLDGAVSIWDFLVDSIFKKYSLKGEGKARISKEVVPVLANIDDAIVKSHYVGLVAKRLDVPPEAVFTELDRLKLKPSATISSIGSLVKQPEKSRRVLLEERLLAICFQGDPTVLLKREVKNLIITPLASRIVEELGNFVNKEKFSQAQFAASLPKELVRGFTDMVLVDAGIGETSPDHLNKEVGVIVRELEVLSIRKTLEELSAKMRQFEEDKSLSKLEKAQIRFAELARRLSRLEEAEKKGIITY